MADMQPPPSDLGAAVAGYAGMAVLARVLWHRRLVRLGQRRFWSIDLAWEVPTAAFTAVAGGGAAEYLGLSGWPAYAVVGAVSWLGPRGLEVMLGRLAAARLGVANPGGADEGTGS